MSEPIRDAIILAAGRGTRLKSLGDSIPKGFLRLGDKTIIEESIEKLLCFGIENILIVTGHLGDRYEALATACSAVTTIKNDAYADSGSMFSLYCARAYVRRPFLLLESDLIYEKRSLGALLRCPRQDCILLSGATASGDEVYVDVRGGRVTHLSKDRHAVSADAGELVGISKISPRLFESMAAHCEKVFKTNRNFEYDTGCLSAVAKETEIHATRIDDLRWAEIDDEHHLRRAREEIYPEILRLDGLSNA